MQNYDCAILPIQLMINLYPYHFHYTMNEYMQKRDCTTIARTDFLEEIAK